MAGLKTSDKLLAATQAVFNALNPLEEPERRRVLNSVLSLLGISALSPASPTNKLATLTPGTEPANSARPTSLVEILRQKQPATNPHRIAIFAYYRDKVEGVAQFAPAELRAYFARAREKEPKNYGRDFENAVKLGYIHEAGAQSYLTNAGEKAVEAGFGGKAAPRGNTAKSGGRKRAKK